MVGQRRSLGVSMFEFVALMAMLMALTALSVDIMLTVLDEIGADYGLENSNTEQFVVVAYVLSFALGHVVVGPLSDRIGRKPVIVGGLVVYAAGSALAVFADSFELFLAARVIQGLGAAGPRVVAIAVIRDCFVGRAMSEVMSFVMLVFIMLPIIAPALGAGIAAFGSWHPIFTFLLVFALAVALWAMLRLPETNPRTGPDVMPVVPFARAVAMTFGNRQTAGYMAALGFLFGSIIVYVSTARQLFEDVYGIVDWFPAAFASAAGAMVVSSLVNSRFVRRLGMRRMSHGALVCLIVTMAVANLLHLALPVLPLAVFLPAMSLAFLFIGLILPNFNALAMEPLGRIAGTGSALVGFTMTGMGALLGGAVGQSYDGTLGPLLVGFLASSIVVLAAVLVTEGGRLAEGAAQGAPAE